MANNDRSFAAAWQPRMLGVLRIVTGFLFMQHGMQKVLGFPPSPNPMPALDSIMGIGGLIELVGGALMILGLLTRPVAFILAGQMAIAYFWKHAPGGFWPIVNKGEPAALYCFVFLYFAVAGAGAFSFDSLFKHAKVEDDDEADTTVTATSKPQLRPH